VFHKFQCVTWPWGDELDMHVLSGIANVQQSSVVISAYLNFSLKSSLLGFDNANE